MLGVKERACLVRAILAWFIIRSANDNMRHKTAAIFGD
jgi:hypothetical protein